MREVPRKPRPGRPLLERAIAGVAPGWAAARAEARRKLALEEYRTGGIQAASGWASGRSERPALRNFNPHARTADADSLPNLSLQRARARDLHMNTPLARGAVQTVVANVVGTGLKLTAQTDRDALEAAGLTDDEIDAAELAMEREWRLFTSGTTADAFRRLTWPQQEELAFSSALVNGDSFAAFVAAPFAGAFDVALQLIEADAVSNENRKSDSETLADGIVYDAGGVPIAIQVAKIPRHMTGRPTTWTTLPMRAPDGAPRVLHLMRPDRIGQSRGVPYLAPVMDMLRDLGTFTEAELRAAVMTACIAITTRTPEGGSPLLTETSATKGQQAGTLQRADIDFQPGMVVEGFLPDESLDSFGSERPSTGFDPFVQAILRQIGVALELPFEVLIKHFTASYSAARAALLEAWKFYRGRRAWLADALHRPTYGVVIENAVHRGRLVLPGFLEDPMIRAAWLGSAWNGPSPGQINPEVEVNAADKRVQSAFSDYARETAELTGENWEAVIRTRSKQIKLMQKLGVPLPGIGHNGGPALMPDTPDKPDLPGEDDEAPPVPARPAETIA